MKGTVMVIPLFSTTRCCGMPFGLFRVAPIGYKSRDGKRYFEVLLYKYNGSPDVTVDEAIADHDSYGTPCKDSFAIEYSHYVRQRCGDEKSEHYLWCLKREDGDGEFIILPQTS